VLLFIQSSGYEWKTDEVMPPYRRVGAEYRKMLCSSEILGVCVCVCVCVCVLSRKLESLQIVR